MKHIDIVGLLGALILLGIIIICIFFGVFYLVDHASTRHQTIVEYCRQQYKPDYTAVRNCIWDIDIGVRKLGD
jgi:hypothetical protein